MHHRPSSQFLTAIIVLKCIFFLLGVVGNTSVVMFHAFVNCDKTRKNYLVTNLACADLLVCLTVYPTWIFHYIQIIKGMENPSDFICRFAYVAGSVTVALSIFSLLSITYDRYIFIIQPLHYTSIMTQRRTCLILAGVWIFALAVIPSSVLIGILGKLQGKCGDVPKGEMWILIAVADVPIAFIVYLNWKIFNVAREQTRRITAQNAILHGNTSRRCNVKEIKAIKTFASITGVLFCCFFPVSIMTIVEQLVCSTCVPVILHFLILEMIGINSIVNAYIYGIRHRQYRKGYGKIVSMLFTCFTTGKLR